jgi:hypothetical protein
MKKDEGSIECPKDIINMIEESGMHIVPCVTTNESINTKLLSFNTCGEVDAYLKGYHDGKMASDPEYRKRHEESQALFKELEEKIYSSLGIAPYLIGVDLAREGDRTSYAPKQEK